MKCEDVDHLESCEASTLVQLHAYHPHLEMKKFTVKAGGWGRSLFVFSMVVSTCPLHLNVDSLLQNLSIGNHYS